ncbi:twin-arginine translocase TatA/TatE family subunit [Amycolatopsis minnesotensis]|uniref:Sec-independent protein translocase protein TatB n=1 Tax=Amycolatopsis minnesotensis TaxID=337894 RepID=A0ABN2T026_9PSEU
MFGLSIEHLLVLAVAALFILGPERLPGAAEWAGRAIRRTRAMLAQARDEVANDLGADFDELREPLQDLADLCTTGQRAVLNRYLNEPEVPPRRARAPRPR